MKMQIIGDRFKGILLDIKGNLYFGWEKWPVLYPRERLTLGPLSIMRDEVPEVTSHCLYTPGRIDCKRGALVKCRSPRASIHKTLCNAHHFTRDVREILETDEDCYMFDNPSEKVVIFRRYKTIGLIKQDGSVSYDIPSFDKLDYVQTNSYSERSRVNAVFSDLIRFFRDRSY